MWSTDALRASICLRMWRAFSRVTMGWSQKEVDVGMQEIEGHLENGSKEKWLDGDWKKW